MKILTLFLASLPASGQIFSFGIIGGGVATGGLDSFAQNTWAGKRYTVGPSAELRLPLPRLSVEVDGLYSRAGQRNSGCVLTYCSYSEVRANVFQFPVLLRYDLLKRSPARPFVEAGPSLQWVRQASGTALSWRNGQIAPNEVVDYTVHRSAISMPAENHVGIVAGGGIDFRAGPIRIAPQVRYTRWNSPYWEMMGSRGFFTASNQNQVDGLVSVRF